MNNQQEKQRATFRKILHEMNPILINKHIWEKRDRGIEKKSAEMEYFVDRDLDIPLLLGSKKVFGPGSKCV